MATLFVESTVRFAVNFFDVFDSGLPDVELLELVCLDSMIGVCHWFGILGICFVHASCRWTQYERMSTSWMCW